MLTINERCLHFYLDTEQEETVAVFVCRCCLVNTVILNEISSSVVLTFSLVWWPKRVYLWSWLLLLHTVCSMMSQYTQTAILHVGYYNSFYKATHLNHTFLVYHLNKLRTCKPAFAALRNSLGLLHMGQHRDHSESAYLAIYPVASGTIYLGL